MNQEIYKLIKAKEILEKIAEGVDPINGGMIEEGSFLHDPRMVRCLHFISGVLNKEIGREYNKFSDRPLKFILAEEDKKRVVLPQGNISISAFADSVNSVLDLSKSKKLTAMEINSQLRKIGILGEAPGSSGKLRSVLNEKSGKYGMELERRSRSGREYDAIVFNDTGKKFLLDNIEKIMAYEKSK